MPGSAGVSPVGSAHHAWERGRLARVCNTQYRCPRPTMMKIEHINRIRSPSCRGADEG
jgi:hypothetical protein